MLVFLSWAWGWRTAMFQISGFYCNWACGATCEYHGPPIQGVVNALGNLELFRRLATAYLGLTWGWRPINQAITIWVAAEAFQMEAKPDVYYGSILE